jgi:hypothetical protein
MRRFAIIFCAAFLLVTALIVRGEIDGLNGRVNALTVQQAQMQSQVNDVQVASVRTLNELLADVAAISRMLGAAGQNGWAP